MSGAKTKTRSRGKRVHISSEQSEEIRKYSEQCAEKGILPGSEKFLEGLTKILNKDTEIETRVACEFGIKGVQGHIYKPKGREKEPWWMHILDGKYPSDALRYFNLYELELLIKDLTENTGFMCTSMPKDKDGRIERLKDLILLAVAKNRDIVRCPHYTHSAMLGWVPENWCYNCERDCLRDSAPKSTATAKKDYQLFDNDPHSYTDRDIPDNA